MELGDGTYEARIRWTTHGVPHISAADTASLSFGQGWACARDHLPTIADQVLKVRSERAAHFGPGELDRHRSSDLGYLSLGVRHRAEAMPGSQPPEVVAMVEAYAAGINTWLAEHGTADLPAWCAGAPWIRPISALDLFTLYVDLAIIASGRNLAEYIGAARPPGAPGPTMPAGGLPEPGLGSNGWALGGDATSTGRGMVVANPHFPWYGEARFWECHLQVPGDLDVYGAALIGTPGIQIGLNRTVAWTHTFSRGSRFTAYKLELPDGDPTSYRYGGEQRAMSTAEHTIQVLGDDGERQVETHTLWSSHYGPMVALPFLGWGDTHAFTYRDANIDNDRFLQLVLAMGRADGVPGLRDAMAEHHGMPWVNTVAADADGRCWYIDSSPTPALTAEAEAAFIANVEGDPITNLLFENRVALLDGSDPTFEWQDLGSGAGSGLLPFDELPQVERRDHVFNANDPYWLPHADEQLPQASSMHGMHHKPVSPRTRMNALLLAGRGPVGPTHEGERFTPEDLEAALLGNHSLLAELLLDDVLARCADVPTATAGGREVELGDAVRILGAWDRRFDVTSVGAVLWRELLAGFPDAALRDAGALFAAAWDPQDPVATPHTLTPVPDGGADPLPGALAGAIVAMEQAGIALDAPLGDVQFVERSGQRIAMHGANEIEGIANVVAPLGALARSDLEPGVAELPTIPGRTERTGLRVGGYPTIYGTSFVMIAWFDDDGPHARGLLAYGQSGDPASPHHADQTVAFSEKALRPMLLTDAEIDADPNLSERTVSG